MFVSAFPLENTNFREGYRLRNSGNSYVSRSNGIESLELVTIDILHLDAYIRVSRERRTGRCMNTSILWLYVCTIENQIEPPVYTRACTATHSNVGACRSCGAIGIHI